jgi:hypothetical protein
LRNLWRMALLEWLRNRRNDDVRFNTIKKRDGYRGIIGEMIGTDGLFCRIGTSVYYKWLELGIPYTVMLQSVPFYS